MFESQQVGPRERAPANDRRSGCGSYTLLILAAAWVLFVTVLTQVPTWVIDNIRMDSTNGLAGWIWVAVTWGQALLTGLLLVPLALLTRPPALRAVYQTWALAAGAVAVLALARIFTITQTDQATALQILLCLVAAVLVWLAGRASGRRVTAGAAWLPAALALAAVNALPSLIWGALGSPLDAALQLAAGLSFGLLAGLLMAAWLFGPLQSARTELRSTDVTPGDLPNPRRHGVLATFGAGTALFILASAFGFRGSQFLMLIALPPLAVALSGLEALRNTRREDTAEASGLAASEGEPTSISPRYAPGAWLPTCALAGLGAAVLAMFWDPIELSLVLGAGDILGWALRAAEFSLVLAAIGGVVVWAIAAWSGRRAVTGTAPSGQATAALDGRQAASQAVSPTSAGQRPAWPARVAVWSAVALLLWAGGLVVYGRTGHPGFYGEQFFVILRDQPDVQGAYRITARDDRLRYVYNTLTTHAEQSQARLRQALDGRSIKYQPYYLVNALQVDGGPLLRAYMAGQPEVDRIVDSQTLRPLPTLPEPMEGTTAPEGAGWNIQAIGADRVWNELKVTGRGIVVGQSDSGVQGDHPAVADNYRGKNGHDDYNWLDPWYGTRQPVDVGGHGTHTLGTVLGGGGIGIAPDAEWMACVNLARNLGNPGWYLNCLQFMLAPYPQGGNAFRDGDPTRAAHVLNNSWGCPPIEGCDPNTLAAATRALRAAGIFVVASAGNGGPACGTVSDPIAVYQDVLSVGAIDREGNLGSFSSRGPVTVDGSDRIKPDIVAPGVDVVSALPGSTYGSETGTSMAGPHLAGVVALMWSAQPKLIGQIDQTTQILVQTARPYTGTLDSCAGGQRPNNDAGYGVVDAYAAVKAAQEVK